MNLAKTVVSYMRLIKTVSVFGGGKVCSVKQKGFVY